MQPFRTLIFIVAAMVFLPPGRAEEKPAGGWSADLLNRILQTETTPAPSTVNPAAGEMVLHTYHLNHLQVGAAGKAQNLVVILEKLLPPGSSLNPDVPANCIHVLTTPAVHQAVWNYLSTVDLPERVPSTMPGGIPDDVKAALKKLADASDQSARLVQVLDGLKSDVSSEIARIDARQRQQTLRLALIGAGFAAILLLTFIWTLRLRRAPTINDAAPSMALALAPEQLTIALAPVHDRMRDDMLAMLNEVAIKLQAQHNEQQKLVREQQQQIEDARLALLEERQQFISATGSMVVEAVERVDATTAKLAKQQDKVAELVQELQHTVRELDDTKDNLRTREVELEQERSKIAALSILLEEGGVPPDTRISGNGGGPNGTSAFAALNHTRSVAPSSEGVALSPTCTNPDLNQPSATSLASTPQFQFLPPDHPET